MLLLVNLELLLRIPQHYSPNLVTVSQILLLQMNGQGDKTSHQSNLLQPTTATKCSYHSKLCKSVNPQSSHCKPPFLGLPRFLSNKNQVHRKTSAANPQLWWSGWVCLLQKSQDELLETTSYFESSCADWQYIDLIMRLLQEGNLWNPNSCGVRTAFQRTSLWSSIVEVESGGGHPWRSPHRISLLLVQNSIFQLNC